MKPYGMKPTTPAASANSEDLGELARQLTEASERLSEMAADVGAAKHVLEYDGDRRKRVLAIAANPLLAAGSSSVAADTEARASEPYHKAMQQLGREHEAACKVVAEWEAAKIKVDVARSLLSMEKTKIGIL